MGRIKIIFKIGLPVFFILVVSAGPLLAGSSSLKTVSSVRIIEDFSDEEVGNFPSNFRTYPFQHRKAMKVYSVQSDGANRFLNATVRGATQEIAIQIFKKFNWDLFQWPNLSWKWRARALPHWLPSEKIDDHACSIYVVFGGWGGKALKYVWSSDEPAGTVIEESPHEFYEVVKTSGGRKIGEWQEISINVAQEYLRFFKLAPRRNPVGIGLLTDGDGSKSPAICDYDDFKIFQN